MIQPINETVIGNIKATLQNSIAELTVFMDEVEQLELREKSLDNKKVALQDTARSIAEQDAKLNEKWEKLEKFVEQIRQEKATHLKRKEDLATEEHRLSVLSKSLDKREKDVQGMEDIKDNLELRTNQLDEREKRLNKKETDLKELETHLETEKALDRDRKETLDAREKKIKQREERMQRLTEV